MNEEGTMVPQYRVVQFYAENFKRLKLVQFKPKGRMTIFTGKNGQGKTSALDVVSYLLGGAKWSPTSPTRKGAKGHKVLLGVKGEAGAFNVVRTQSGPLKLEMAPGSKAWDTPQAMVDSIFDNLALDPMQFVRQEPEKQVETLRKFLKLDFADLDAENVRDTDTRKAINAECRGLAAEIGLITYSDELPEDKIDVAEINQRIHDAGLENQQLVQRIETKNKLAAELRQALENAERHVNLIASAEAKLEKLASDLALYDPLLQQAAKVRDGVDDLIEMALPFRGTELASALEMSHSKAVAYISTTGAQKSETQHQMELQRKILKAAEITKSEVAQAVEIARAAWEEAPTGQLVNTNELMAELDKAKLINSEIDRRTRRGVLETVLEEKKAAYAALGNKIDGRDEEKRQRIASTPMPIEGLTLTETEVLFDGIPLQQLGEAQQIRIGVSLVLAGKPKLRLIRIPHGESLDEESMEALAAMAEEMDFYVWMARVDSSGKVGIYLEDGEIKANNDEGTE
jgi:hypothetical protein